MADKKITGLTELTAAASDDYLEIVDTSTNTNKKISRETLAGWHFLSTPLTSTAWDGDLFSTTSKTLIDLSSEFGVPAGVKAVYAFVAIKDSASSTTETYFRLSPNNYSSSGLAVNCGHLDDVYTRHNFIVPCDSNGDIYYEIKASGTDTMDVYIQIWGYWL